MRLKIILSSLVLGGILQFAHAQKKLQDQIVAQVGNSIILESDLKERYLQEEENYVTSNKEDAYCHLLYTSIAEKILANMARSDSALMIDEAKIELTIQAQIEEFLERANHDVELLKRHSGRTPEEMRRDFKPIFDDMLHAQNAQQSIISSVKMTPKEVKDFYEKIPKDSLEIIPATVEIGNIIIKPKVHPEVETMTKERLEEIRKEIVEDGKDFGTLASLYSQDGTAKDGGLITIDRKGFDPHFVAAAYRLQPGEISPVTKSKFGYHLIKMERRTGDIALVRHIVLIPQPTSSDIREAKAELDSIKTELEKGNITFNQAVAKHSTDLESKFTSGMLLHPQTQRTQVPLDHLTRLDIIKGIGEMKVGEYSDPVEHRNEKTGELEVRLYYLKNKTEAHQLNLKDDYALIQEVALQEKQNEHLQNFINKESKKYYIKINKEYKDCELIQALHTTEIQ